MSVLIATGSAAAGGSEDCLAPWRESVRVTAVLPDAKLHTVHTYYLASPESPDGEWALMYTSATPEGHVGDIRIVERSTGKQRALAENVTVEDIHRAACQQWVSGGRRVVFHDLRKGKWVVVSVDVGTGGEQVFAEGRQLGWGPPDHDIVPLYGPHWDPGDHRDLELLDVRTGKVRTVLTAREVRKAYPEYTAEKLGERPVSIFFPALSADLNRVFFKVATPAGGHFRSPKASIRKGLFVYNLTDRRFVYMRTYYGHPAWCPDSRTLLWSSVSPGGLVLIDTGGSSIPRMGQRPPSFPGSHPACSPDARLFTVDTRLEPFGGPKGHWGVAVGDMRTGDHVFVHKFDNSRGATSWRRANPHPVFSPDGRRLYFSVSAGQWTQLYVAECARGLGK